MARTSFAGYTARALTPVAMRCISPAFSTQGPPHLPPCEVVLRLLPQGISDHVQLLLNAGSDGVVGRDCELFTWSRKKVVQREDSCGG